MKQMLAIAVVVFVTGALLVAQQQPTPANDIDGVWKLVISEKNDKRPLGEAFMAVQRSGDQLVMRDLSGTTSVRTAANSATLVPVRIAGLDGVAVPDTVAQIVVPAEQAKKAERMSELVKTWELQVGGNVPKKTGWTVYAIKLTSVWACSHSNPTHTATTTNEMQEASKKHMCTGWRQVTQP